MKKIRLILSAGVLLFLASCGNKPAETDATTMADTTATDSAAAVTPTPPAFTPFKMSAVMHKVKDFQKWRAVYMSADSLRNAYGMSRFRIGRGLEDSNMVYVYEIINDMAKAKEFSTSAGLKDAMKKAGVMGEPQSAGWDVVRLDSTVTETKDRVRISHKVKDFDAWLKVYDGEGKETRKANGMVDIALSRNVDDPNMISIVFGITDMAKAKARMNSAELKALMLGAGVDGPPTISFYKLVD